jgi:hypothetical protein
MNVYYIDRPSVSNGLKRTYHKKLEVYYGALENLVARAYNNTQIYISFRANSVYIYNQKKNIWVQKKSTKFLSIHLPVDRIFETAEVNKPGVYTTLEAACVAKLILIERMAEEYKKELKKLQETFKRNVPNVEQPFNQLLETHPDLFV